MDPVRNPFVPGAGTAPPKLAGREGVLVRTKTTLQRVMKRRNSKSFIVVGLRGVGKTVLLNQVYDTADELGFFALQIEARENKRLPSLIIPKFRQLLLKISSGEKAAQWGKRALRVLAAFANSVRATVGDVEFSVSIQPEYGTADSGDLETDLADLFEVVGEAAREKGTAIVLIIDELQYLDEEEMSALIMALHRVSQRNLPLVLVGGGLPQLVGLAGRSKSYAERLFDYPEVSALDREEAFEAIIDPILDEGTNIEAAAVERIFSLTQGYPYFIQTWGHFAWNVAEGSSISEKDVIKATSIAIKSLDESFFRVRFDRITPVEKQYLFAMAELGFGPHRSGDIAARLGRKVESVAPTRSSLIKKGMIFSPAHGDTAFTVPMFDEYLNRIRTQE